MPNRPDGYTRNRSLKLPSKLHHSCICQIAPFLLLPSIPVSRFLNFYLLSFSHLSSFLALFVHCPPRWIFRCESFVTFVSLLRQGFLYPWWSNKFYAFSFLSFRVLLSSLSDWNGEILHLEFKFEDKRRDELRRWLIN